ncbi:MAG: fatty-acyl-CoA synthase [Hyphomonadaceae bacterium]|nr:MAG: fatty-acyl-CoA synthase [Hyphomonadaceae bacterium]
MLGLMQNWQLTVDKIIEHAAINHTNREIVTRSVEGPIVRTTYGNIFTRAKKVSNWLLGQGIKLGDRVASLAWNSGHHMESWYGTMGIGAIMHTLNPRLFPEQLVYIINHAEDKIIFTDLTFLPILEAIHDKCPCVKAFVVFTDGANMPPTKLPNCHAYEDILQGQSDISIWGNFEENTACGLCYTSGTTGNPKGVLYSHRTNVLHTLLTMGADVMGLTAGDVILPVVPMFHANAWGIAFSAPACGSKLVMPGAKMDGASIYELLETEKVTFSAAVPTVWLMLLQYLESTNQKLSTLKQVVIGGAALPEHILRSFEDKYGVGIRHAWGMTETSPLGTLGTPGPEAANYSREEIIKTKLKQGRSPFGVELKIKRDGKTVPRDGETFGNLMVRGAAIAGAYFKNEGGDILDEEGFFDTGDVATIDEHGYMQITDRSKDVIKSGGEWIGTIDIENCAVGCEGVACAAVIGIYHPKWDERPLLIIEKKAGANPTKEDLMAHLNGKIAKWWMPDDVRFVETIPLGATGKINKIALRETFKDLKFG